MHSKNQLKLRSKILEQIYVQGPISRIDIAKNTSITPATTSSITADLIREGYIKEIGEEETSIIKAGRKKILLRVEEGKACLIGIELSEKYLSIVATDSKGNLLREQTVTLSNKRIREEGSQLILDLLLPFIDSLPEKAKLIAIGIGLPGRYLNDFRITTDNPLWKHFDLKVVADALPYPIYFSNNVNCMSLAQRLFFNQGKDLNFVFFHFGRGMHCSYMYNGAIYGKHNSIIGEIGHTVVQPDGELCSCGKRGCLQTYAGETWLIKKAQLLYQNADQSLLPNLVQDPEDIRLETLLTAYELGDAGTIHLLNTSLKYLAQSILNLNMLIDSQVIYLHSPLLLNEQLENLLKHLIHLEPKVLATQETPPVHIVPYSVLTGARAATALALYKGLLEY
ncbi:TPA: ROK family protein [Streptococcus suis]|nr:ROK family protein [Streptococcus suis]HEL2265043.1 ROK family protein [Streptococcus suis]HEL2299091.1 ROK family protein [Streptococcus suis]HEL2406559.1 ROK family protein [Streptococcus suis]HEM4567823.1 ROK family protein [Streptococcus suis]